MERFVGLIVSGGLALVGGLWVARWTAPTATGWLLGIGAAVVGVGALLLGIANELTVQ